jgi:O-antigen ligase
MPEHLRAVIVILVLSTAVFAVANRPACAISATGDFTRRRNLWFILTTSVFLAYNFWLYLCAAIPLLAYANRRETNPPALFFFILFVLPLGIVTIPGFGLINFLFELTNFRVIALFVLLPAFFSLRRQRDNPSFGRLWTDKVFAIYLLITVALYFRANTETNVLRLAFYTFLDAFLPYFVISRSLKTIQSFRDALLSLVIAIMVMAPIAGFESVRHWLLYSSLDDIFDPQVGSTFYLGREGMLRAIVTTGQPIALGYLMVIGIGLYLYLQRLVQNKTLRWAGMALLAFGLAAPLSRGPWVGAAALIVVFVATGRYPLRRLTTLAVAGVFLLTLISMLPGGEKVTNLLPFVGTTEKSNIDYREQLITNSMVVIMRNPLFGSSDYLKTPEMQALIQGQGIIDIVNSYIGIALRTGFTGLALFVAFFAAVLAGLYRAMRSIPDKDSEEFLLGRVLFATLVSVLVMIFTVSSISFIAIMYWCLAGLAVAYALMVRKRSA